MDSSAKAKIEQIKNQLEFLTYKYHWVGSVDYKSVYANGHGAMYYSIPSIQKEFDKHYVVLINNKFRAFRSNPSADTIKWRNGNNITVIQNSETGFIQSDDFYFARPHLNRNNSLSFINDDDLDSDFEFNSEFQKQLCLGKNPIFNDINRMKTLPNGFSIEYQYKSPLVNIMYNGNEKPVIENVKSIQQLDKNSCVIWIDNDLYIIDWDAKPTQYDDAISQVSAQGKTQKLVNEYKKRYMNIVDIILSNGKSSK